MNNKYLAGNVDENTGIIYATTVDGTSISICTHKDFYLQIIPRRHVCRKCGAVNYGGKWEIEGEKNGN